MLTLLRRFEPKSINKIILEEKNIIIQTDYGIEGLIDILIPDHNQSEKENLKNLFDSLKGRHQNELPQAASYTLLLMILARSYKFMLPETHEEQY